MTDPEREAADQTIERLARLLNEELTPRCIAFVLICAEPVEGGFMGGVLSNLERDQVFSLILSQLGNIIDDEGEEIGGTEAVAGHA